MIALKKHWQSKSACDWLCYIFSQPAAYIKPRLRILEVYSLTGCKGIPCLDSQTKRSWPQALTSELCSGDTHRSCDKNGDRMYFHGWLDWFLYTILSN